MDIKSAFPSKYFNAADITHPRGMTISSVKKERVRDEDKIVMRFIGEQKALIVNVTNANRIADAYGSESDAWSGRPVTLVKETVYFRGSPVPGIVVRIPAGSSPAPANTDDLDDALAS